MVLKFKRCQILLLLFLLAYPHFVDAVRNDGRRSSRRTYTMTCKLPQAFSGGDGLMRGMSFGVPEEAQRIRIIGPKFKVTFDSTIVPDLVAALNNALEQYGRTERIELDESEARIDALFVPALQAASDCLGVIISEMNIKVKVDEVRIDSGIEEIIMKSMRRLNVLEVLQLPLPHGRHIRAGQETQNVLIIAAILEILRQIDLGTDITDYYVTEDSQQASVTSREPYLFEKVVEKIHALASVQSKKYGLYALAAILSAVGIGAPSSLSWLLPTKSSANSVAGIKGNITFTDGSEGVFDGVADFTVLTNNGTTTTGVSNSFDFGQMLIFSFVALFVITFLYQAFRFIVSKQQEKEVAKHVEYVRSKQQGLRVVIDSD